jgi:hypothetical protein
MILVTSFVFGRSKARNIELLFALKRNVDNAAISSIIIITEDRTIKEIVRDIAKVHVIESNCRPTYGKYLRIGITDRVDYDPAQIYIHAEIS